MLYSRVHKILLRAPILNHNESSPYSKALFFEDSLIVVLTPPTPVHNYTSKAVRDYKDNFKNSLNCKYDTCKFYKMHSQNCKLRTLDV
jgi:hypothetical protein